MAKKDNRNLWIGIAVIVIVVIIILALSGTFTGKVTKEQNEKLDTFYDRMKSELNYDRQAGMPRVETIGERRNFSWRESEYPYQLFKDLLEELSKNQINAKDFLSDIALDDELNATFWRVVDKFISENPLPEF